MKGKVTLVGAGPGDIGLLTIKGKKAVENAEVVVYDRLVSDEILGLISEDAERINAGKKSGEHNITQNEINKILVEKAMEGKNVVRLKGGDCFVFARGAEELLELEKNGIDFQVIPGITSAFAVSAYAGIPATYRDFVSSVHLITGRQKDNGELKIDFKSLVKLNGTLIFYMALKNIEIIADRLIKEGMREDMPCAVIQNGTRNDQKCILSVLSDISRKVIEENLKSPALIIVGEVGSLRDRLDWFEKLPLKGKNVVVTRAKRQSSSLTGALKELGANVIENPCIRIKSVIGEKISFDKIKKSVDNSDWIAFTSPNGVSIFFDEVKKNGLDARIFSGKRVGVIGSATARELLKYNIRRDLMPDKFYSKELAESFCRELNEGERICILRAEKGSKEFTDILNKNNISFDDIGIYETIYENKESKKLQECINSGKFDFVTFTSKSTVDAFCEIIGDADYGKIKAVCIGEKTAEAARVKGMEVFVSDEVAISSMIDKLLEIEAINGQIPKLHKNRGLCPPMSLT